MTAIVKDMDFDQWRLVWFQMCRDKGHTLKEYDDEAGRIDEFVSSGGHHNGPGCVKCGWSECMHCDFEGKNIPQCPAVSNGEGQ